MKPWLKIFSLASLLILPLFLSSQAWQWAERGGSVNNMDVSREYNNVLDMATDPAGNVYTLGPVGGAGLKVANQSLTAYSSSGISNTTDILLSSFSEDGSFRWAKVIGGSTRDLGHSVQTDSLGHIYVTGHILNTAPNFFNTAVHFDTDTVLPQYTSSDSLRKIMFLVQYDTSGNFQWLRMPEPDTVSSVNQGLRNSLSYRSVTCPQGHTYWLCHLRPGQFSWNGNNIISQAGEYVLKYDINGNVTGKTRLAMETDRMMYYGGGDKMYFERDHSNGNYYVAGFYSGTRDFLIGGDTINNTAYIAAFDSAGQFQWKIESGGTDIISIEDLVTDSEGNTYLTGYGRTGTTFGSFTLQHNNGTTTPFIIKISKAGSVLWGRNGKVNAISPSEAIAVSDSEVAIAGYAGRLYWPGETDTMKAVLNQGYDAFIARFDKQSGDLITMDRTTTNFGGAAYGHAITAGKENGEYYVGGNFDQLVFLHNDTLTKVGSQRSFFVMKYACDLPGDISFATAGNNPQKLVAFRYTGGDADSVTWRFGDGSSATGDTVTHTFSQKQTYRVCMTAHFDCTEKTVCDSVAAGSISIEEFEGEVFSVFPNPSGAVFQLETRNTELEVSVVDVLGREVFRESGKGNQLEIDLSQESAGVYFLMLKRDGKPIFTQKLILE